jgi:hypothetical protein
LAAADSALRGVAAFEQKQLAWRREAAQGAESERRTFSWPLSSSLDMQDGCAVAAKHKMSTQLEIDASRLKPLFSGGERRCDSLKDNRSEATEQALSPQLQRPVKKDVAEIGKLHEAVS